MQVREVMTENPACCTPDSMLKEVARLMVEHDCGCIPIVKDLSGRKPVGTITDRDIAVRTVAGGQNPLNMKASDIMSIDIATVKPDTSIEECLDVMQNKDIRRVLVVDENGSCRGIVAQADVVQFSTNHERTNRVIREISESSPSRTLTMSKDYGNNKSSSNYRTFLPLLIGIAIPAAGYYFGSKKKQGVSFNSQNSSRQTTTNYPKLETEVNRRQDVLQSSVNTVKTETSHSTSSKSETFLGRFEIKQSVDGKYHFNLKAGNGETILTSEMYESRDSAVNGIDSVKRNAVNVHYFERRVGSSNEPYFTLKADNGEVIGKSETYSSTEAREKGLISVMQIAPTAQISESAG